MVEEHKGKEEPKYLNPNDFFANELDSWTTLWNNDLTLYHNILSIVSRIVFLPDPHLFNPLVTVYLLLPSKWIRVAGIMFSYGDEGSGKSTIAKFANEVRGFTSTFSPTDTFSSIRNGLDSMRWIDPAFKKLEKEGALLAWDNISIDTLLRDQKVYQLLLVGYDRKTDRIAIADSQGKNKEYYVFCPKIISSVEPIHLHYEFKELRRRLFVIPHKKWEKFNPEEKADYDGIDIVNDKINLESIDWSDFPNQYYQFWNYEPNCLQYVHWRNLLTRKGKKDFKIPDSITSARWAITVDVLAVGLTLGAWSGIAEALEYFDAYWSYCNRYIFNEFGATLEHLRDFVNGEASTTHALNEQFIANGIKPQPVIISPAKLKNKLVALQNEGYLDIAPNNRDIQALMRELGYRLTKKGWMEK